MIASVDEKTHTFLKILQNLINSKIIAIFAVVCIEVAFSSDATLHLGAVKQPLQKTLLPPTSR
jgi:long-subunit acyl-CoA synthetase (AMP-forming)